MLVGIRVLPYDQRQDMINEQLLGLIRMAVLCWETTVQSWQCSLQERYRAHPEISQQMKWKRKGTRLRGPYHQDLYLPYQYLLQIFRNWDYVPLLLFLFDKSQFCIHFVSMLEVFSLHCCILWLEMLHNLIQSCISHIVYNILSAYSVQKYYILNLYPVSRNLFSL